MNVLCTIIPSEGRMMVDNRTILRVSVVQFYEIGRVMEGNGWTAEQVIKDWFRNGRINQPHASRRSSHILYADEFLDAEVLSEEEAGFNVHSV